MVRIGKRLVRNFYNKVPGVIAELVADLGAEAVSAALRDLDATGERFPGQIGLEAAIRDRATPEPPAAELEELDELVGDAPDPVAIAHRLVTATHRAKSAQIAEHIGAAVTRYGRASVTDALVTLESLPERFPWPEKLADAIDAHIAEMAHRRREKATRDMHDDDQLDADEGMYHLSPMSPLSLDRDRRDRSDTTLTLLPGGEG